MDEVAQRVMENLRLDEFFHGVDGKLAPKPSVVVDEGPLVSIGLGERSAKFLSPNALLDLKVTRPHEAYQIEEQGKWLDIRTSSTTRMVDFSVVGDVIFGRKTMFLFDREGRVMAEYVTSAENICSARWALREFLTNDKRLLSLDFYEQGS